MSSTAEEKTARLPGWLHDVIERHLEEQTELPVLPEASARVVALCQDESSDARSIESVLERDPALTSHVLRVANSTAYAPKEPIVSLQQAVSRLGFGVMRDIVLAQALQGRVFRVAGHEARVRSIWMHCALAAAFAREAARRLRRNVEGAFLCALLHDVGRPVVLQATLDALAHRTKEPLPAALLECAMDEFHAEVAGRMVASWKLPDWTELVVASHHRPDHAGEHEEQAHLVRLVDLLSHWALDETSTPADFAGDDPAVERLNLYPEDVDRLLAYRPRALEFAEAFR